jgi:hypothetical protein
MKTYTEPMPSNHHSLAAEADEVADSVCLRRVVNAFFTMVAVWGLYGVATQRELIDAGQAWWCVAPISVSALATFFAAWAVFFGDRIVWLRAFRRAARASRRDR